MDFRPLNIVAPWALAMLLLGAWCDQAVAQPPTSQGMFPVDDRQVRGSMLRPTFRPGSRPRRPTTIAPGGGGRSPVYTARALQNRPPPSNLPLDGLLPAGPPAGPLGNFPVHNAPLEELPPPQSTSSAQPNHPPPLEADRQVTPEGIMYSDPHGQPMGPGVMAPSPFFPPDGHFPDEAASGFSPIPSFEEMIHKVEKEHCPPQWPLIGFLFGHERSACPDVGVGVERVALAPFFIDVTQPNASLQVKFDSVYDLQFPDRSEYFWARPSNLTAGRGPAAPEGLVDYQQLVFAWEAATSPAMSVATELPIRILDPMTNAQTAGMSDMTLTTKIRLMDGERWQITQFMKNHFNTGAVGKGLGTGHVSLEPGVLFRYRWSDYLYIHSELRYWFALGANPEHSGQVMRWGLGASYVYYENDVFAILPTLEYINLNFLDGQKTVFLTAMDIDNEGVHNLHPGVRFVFDTGGDLGVFELGVAGGFDIGSLGWWEQMVRVHLRWSN